MQLGVNDMPVGKLGGPYSDSTAITRFLAGEIHAHQLPQPLRDLWADGFHAGCQQMQSRADRAEREADRWYYIANNPAEVRAQHARALAEFNAAQHRKTATEQWAALDRVAAERSEATK